MNHKSNAATKGNLKLGQNLAVAKRFLRNRRSPKNADLSLAGGFASGVVGVGESESGGFKSGNPWWILVVWRYPFQAGERTLVAATTPLQKKERKVVNFLGG